MNQVTTPPTVLDDTESASFPPLLTLLIGREGGGMEHEYLARRY